MKDLSSLTSKELAEMAKAKREEERAKKEEERRQALIKREAYEAIRAELVQKISTKVLSVIEEVSGLHSFMCDETAAFREVLSEYGQLRNPGQLSYTIKSGDFKIEVKSNKVKRFDERADVAATRLIDFLLAWVKQTPEGTENLMYQLAMTLLERNKYGDLDYKSISKLYEMEERFANEEYTSIMKLFRESNIVDGTAINFYFWKKDAIGVWRKLEPSFNRL
ncbi:DUF3164 family protein [Parabacteroides sp. AM08-6]|uniref:DUF3164 family protein n=1 Tax=Parabacteroides sp. AM08-6 TaxID=2292053 RepID=UPI000EFEBE47|nr:DUF3164 family protein [Parabacteroides sp. AM08-6]RHJ81192.1 DUF3164 family protein [Parabacteroides sp. AM08-6]